MPSVRARREAATAYAAELRQGPVAAFDDIPRDVGVHAFPSLTASRGGVALTVWGVRFGPDRVELVVSAERSGLVYRVVRDGFVLWDDGRRTPPDRQWSEHTS